MKYNCKSSSKRSFRERRISLIKLGAIVFSEGLILRVKPSEVIFSRPSSKKIGVDRNVKDIQGMITLSCTFNNTHLHYISYVDKYVKKASAGSLSRGALRKKSTFISSLLGEDFGKALRNRGVTAVDLTVQNFGRGRDGTLSGLRKSGLKYNLLKQYTSQSHNGCRPPKMRRL